MLLFVLWMLEFSHACHGHFGNREYFATTKEFHCNASARIAKGGYYQLLTSHVGYKLCFHCRHEDEQQCHELGKVGDSFYDSADWALQVSS